MAYRVRVGSALAPPGGPPAARDARQARPHRAPAVLVALASALGVWVSHAFFVGTATGRAVEELALAGAEDGPEWLWRVAAPVLQVVSVPFVVGVGIGALVMAVARRRPMLAWQAAFVMVGANLTTQLLKALLNAESLDGAGRPYDSLPSGHTTVAASVTAALILVVPVRSRPVAALVGAAYTTLTGLSTLVGGWHRPSDVVAALLVVLAWACVAMLVGSAGARATYDVVPRPGGRVPGARGTVLAVTVLGVGAAAAGVLAAVGLRRTLAVVPVADPSPEMLVAAYVGGAAGIVAATLAVITAVVLLLRVTEPARVRPARPD